MNNVISFPVQNNEVESQPKERYQPDYSIQYGAKYQKRRDIKDIAKLVRADIKAAIRAKTLPEAKYSVSIHRYSMGQSLRINVSALKTPYLMQNPERVMADFLNPHEYPRHSQFSERGNAYLSELQDIVNAYNFDGSDSSIDYFNVNFYSRINFDSQYLKEERQKIIDCCS